LKQIKVTFYEQKIKASKKEKIPKTLQRLFSSGLPARTKPSFGNAQIACCHVTGSGVTI